MRKFFASFLILLLFPGPAFSDYVWGSGYQEDSPPADKVTTDTTLFNNNLSPTDTTVQAALETLDELTAGGSGDIEGVTAGSGLTGGGTSGTVTLTVGAGTGITVNADDVALTIPVAVSSGGTGATTLTDLIALTTHTTGNYVKDVADGTGIDGTASGEGATYTPTLDLTEINSATFGSGTFTSLAFNGAADDYELDLTSAGRWVNTTDGRTILIDYGNGPVGIGEVGMAPTEFIVSTDGIGDGEVKLPARAVGRGELDITNDGATSQFLQRAADGTMLWATPSGSGDVTGPGSSTDNAVARFDGTGGKTLQNSGVTISDTDVITAAGGAFTGDVDLDGSNVNLTLQHTGGAEFGWHVEANDLTYIRKSGGATLIGLGAASELFLGQVGSKVSRVDIHASTAGDTGVNLGAARVGKGEIDFSGITFTRCVYVENLAAGDDNFSMGTFDRPVTIRNVWVNYKGTGTTPATIALEDGAGNAMTHSAPQPTAEGTIPNPQAVTANNTLVAYEMLRFDVSNAVSPETDEYTICVGYTYDN